MFQEKPTLHYINPISPQLPCSHTPISKRNSPQLRNPQQIFTLNIHSLFIHLLFSICLSSSIARSLPLPQPPTIRTSALSSPTPPWSWGPFSDYTSPIDCSELYVRGGRVGQSRILRCVFITYLAHQLINSLPTGTSHQNLPHHRRAHQASRKSSDQRRRENHGHPKVLWIPTQCQLWQSNSEPSLLGHPRCPSPSCSHIRCKTFPCQPQPPIQLAPHGLHKPSILSQLRPSSWRSCSCSYFSSCSSFSCSSCSSRSPCSSCSSASADRRQSNDRLVEGG